MLWNERSLEMWKWLCNASSWPGLVPFCKHESVKPQASVMGEESAPKPRWKKDWRCRGRLKSLWLWILGILLVWALPACVSSSAGFYRGGKGFFGSISQVSQNAAARWMKVERARLSPAAHGWSGEGVGDLRTLVWKLMAVIPTGCVCSWCNGVPRLSVLRGSMSVDPCRCGGGKRWRWRFNWSELCGEAWPVGILDSVLKCLTRSSSSHLHPHSLWK